MAKNRPTDKVEDRRSRYNRTSSHLIALTNKRTSVVAFLNRSQPEVLPGLVSIKLYKLLPVETVIKDKI